MNTQCLELTKDIVGILDGTASESLLEHVAKCDSCRDAKHDLASRAQRIAKAGDDFVVDKPLAARLADMAREAEQAVTAAERERVSETRVRTTASPPITAPVLSATKKSRKATWLLIAACASVGVSVAAGFALAGKHMTTPEAIASRPWHGKVAAVARSGADKTGGLFYDAGSGKNPLADGAELKSGMKISTDGRTRARLELDDGTFVVPRSCDRDLDGERAADDEAERRRDLDRRRPHRQRAARARDDERGRREGARHEAHDHGDARAHQCRGAPWRGRNDRKKRRKSPKNRGGTRGGRRRRRQHRRRARERPRAARGVRRAAHLDAQRGHRSVCERPRRAPRQKARSDQRERTARCASRSTP